MSETFQCASCLGVFEKEWTDEEAEAEWRQWPAHLQRQPRSVICEDCFQAIGRRAKAAGCYYPPSIDDGIRKGEPTE